MLALIDNYDSFTYNLAYYFEELGQKVTVFRNDAISVGQLSALPELEGIVISPGPGTPDQSGVSEGAIRLAMARKLPVLGVCLGLQLLGTMFGGTVVASPPPMHGKTSLIYHQGEGIFAKLPTPFSAMRYHSLILRSGRLSPDLYVTARTENHIVMGIAHRSLPLYGVQFHPESIVSEHGHLLLNNFLDIIRDNEQKDHRGVA